MNQGIRNDLSCRVPVVVNVVVAGYGDSSDDTLTGRMRCFRSSNAVKDEYNKKHF